MHSSPSSSRRPHPLHPPPPVAFRPFLGHGLPELLPPVFSVSCCRIPVRYQDQLFIIPSNIILPSFCKLFHIPYSSETKCHYFWGGIRKSSILATWPAHSNRFKRNNVECTVSSYNFLSSRLSKTAHHMALPPSSSSGTTTSLL